MKKLVSILGLLISSSAFASPYCYQLSTDPKVWTQSDFLCIERTDFDRNQFLVTLKTGLEKDTAAQFFYSITRSSTTSTLETDEYGLFSSSSAVFEKLKIRFMGVSDPYTHASSGQVFIGDTAIYYKSL